MQLQLRIDDNNYVTIEFQLQTPDTNSPADGPELIAATVIDSKLSNLKSDELFDITGQVVDYFNRPQGAPERRPGYDWFNDEWLPATRNNKL